MTSRDLLKQTVERDGWISIALIFFDNMISVSPLNFGGCVCMNNDLLFFPSGFDTLEGSLSSSDYGIAQIGKYGHSATIRCEETLYIQGFETNGFRISDMLEMDKFLMPTFPKESDIEALEIQNNGTVVNYPYATGRRSEGPKTTSNGEDSFILMADRSEGGVEFKPSITDGPWFLKYRTPVIKGRRILRPFVNLYPEITTDSDMSGINITRYKEFIENHRKFTEAVNNFYNLSDPCF